MLKLIGLVTTLAAGFGFGRTTFKLQVRIAILTALVAAIAQTGLRLVLPHDAIEQIAQSHLSTASGQIVIMALAIVETAGLLLPVALMPWTTASIRVWAALYVVGAAFLAAATYYFPFDVVIINDEVIGPEHASYEFALLFCLPLGAIGFLAGWFKRRQRRTATTDVNSGSGNESSNRQEARCTAAVPITISRFGSIWRPSGPPSSNSLIPNDRDF